MMATCCTPPGSYYVSHKFFVNKNRDSASRRQLRSAALPARQIHSSRQKKKECVATAAGGEEKEDTASPRSSSRRREFVLNGSSALVLGSLVDSLVDNSRPADLGLKLGVSKQFGDIVTLGLCPPQPNTNCVSTAEDFGDDSHFVPPWTYNPQEGKGDRGIKNPVSQAQAMEELVDVVRRCKLTSA